MKNCSKCGTSTSDEIKFCSECGHPFAGVNVQDLASVDSSPSSAAANPNAPKTSLWIILSAICLLLLVGMFGWQQYSASKLADCRFQALSADIITRVIDVRVVGLACEYLVQPVVGGDAVGAPNWASQSSFDLYHKDKEK